MSLTRDPDTYPTENDQPGTCACCGEESFDVQTVRIAAIPGVAEQIIPDLCPQCREHVGAA